MGLSLPPTNAGVFPAVEVIMDISKHRPTPPRADDWIAPAFSEHFCASHQVTRGVHELALRVLGLFEDDVDTHEISSAPASKRRSIAERIATLPYEIYLCSTFLSSIAFALLSLLY